MGKRIDEECFFLFDFSQQCSSLLLILLHLLEGVSVCLQILIDLAEAAL